MKQMNWLNSSSGALHLSDAVVTGQSTYEDVVAALEKSGLDFSKISDSKLHIKDCILWDRKYDGLISFRDNRLNLISWRWKDGAPADWEHASEEGFLAELAQTEAWLSEKLGCAPTSADPYQKPPHWRQWQFAWGHVLANYDMKSFSTGLFFYWE